MLVSPRAAPHTAATPEAGTGVPCQVAQCDGVPCPDVQVDCEHCDRAIAADAPRAPRRPDTDDA